jgi:hypothetical protein
VYGNLEEIRLLKTYYTSGIHARRFLVELAYFNLDLISKNQIWANFNDNQKLNRKCYLQIDIISKIMMFSEDIAAFSTAFLENKSFYEMLDTTDTKDDLGKKIKNFYDNVDNLTDKQIYRIMNYMAEEEVNLFETKERDLILRNMKASAVAIKRVLSQIGIFGRTNHPFFKRFKHSALPIYFNKKIDFHESYMQTSETFNIAYVDKNEPFSKPRIIPLSNDVLQSYWTLYKAMDTLLDDMISNRIENLERGLTGILPRSGFDMTVFTKEELKSWKETIDRFYTKYPIKQYQDPIVDNIVIDKKDYEWYANLYEFLELGRNIAEKNKTHKEHQG